MVNIDEENIQKILERLEKLSRRPENPGVAYRNLETIHALIHTLREKMNADNSKLNSCP